MNKKLILILLAAVMVIGGGYLLLNRNDDSQSSSVEIKAAHFESSTPASKATLAAVPPNVTVDFNFDLGTDSEISITREGKEYGQGSTTIDDNKLAMRRDMSQDAPDGVYLVKYNACWPDGSCDEGQFSFTIDSSQQSSYMDLTGQAEVTVRMSQIKFSPMDIRISRGTKVNWVNDDEAIHYVNTDAHPAHTHTADLNSKALNLGDSYAYTFNKTGSYPYHCSAHASTMTGAVVVEE